MIKLNVGCGGMILPGEEGWINIDAKPGDGVDVVVDLHDEELPFEYGSVDHILLQDLLEHLTEARQYPFLVHCYYLLKPGGTIYIQIPDLEVLCKRYCRILENPSPLQHDLDANQLSRSLYAYGDVYDGHKWGYDKYTLRTILEKIGYTINSIGSDGGQNLLCTATRN